MNNADTLFLCVQFGNSYVHLLGVFKLDHMLDYSHISVAVVIGEPNPRSGIHNQNLLLIFQYIWAQKYKLFLQSEAVHLHKNSSQGVFTHNLI